MNRFEFGFPGPLRDKLVAAVLDGSKTTTTGLYLSWEPLPDKGERFSVIDSSGTDVAVIEMIDVKICALSEVDLQHAVDEGEGDRDIASWRAKHEEFFHSKEIREELNDPNFTVTNETRVVLQRFRLV